MTKYNAVLTQILSKAAVPSKQKDGTNESTKSNGHRLTISFTAVNSLSCLLDCCQNGIVRHRRLGNDVGGLGIQLDIEGFDTLELLQDSLHGTGAAATAHGDVELVLMVRHAAFLVWIVC